MPANLNILFLSSDTFLTTTFLNKLSHNTKPIPDNQSHKVRKQTSTLQYSAFQQIEFKQPKLPTLEFNKLIFSLIDLKNSEPKPTDLLLFLLNAQDDIPEEYIDFIRLKLQNPSRILLLIDKPNKIIQQGISHHYDKYLRDMFNQKLKIELSQRQILHINLQEFDQLKSQLILQHIFKELVQPNTQSENPNNFNEKQLVNELVQNFSIQQRQLCIKQILCGNLDEIEFYVTKQTQKQLFLEQVLSLHKYITSRKNIINTNKQKTLIAPTDNKRQKYQNETIEKAVKSAKKIKPNKDLRQKTKIMIIDLLKQYKVKQNIEQHSQALLKNEIQLPLKSIKKDRRKTFVADYQKLKMTNAYFTFPNIYHGNNTQKAQIPPQSKYPKSQSKLSNSSLQITKEDTFEAAIRLINLGFRVVVLDFASGTNPGGGWRGKQQGTQEESLCRRSDLGLLLQKRPYPIPTDGLHYLPVVTITKNKNLQPIPEVKCAVIASQLRSIADRSTKYLQMRINLLYQTSITNKHDVIVLGAWGCGAFKETDDDANILAKEMFICADRYQDKIKTVFAIYGKKNYDAFVQSRRQL